MKITQTYEIGDIRLEASIETKTVESHSKLQSLTKEEFEEIQNKLFMILSDLTNALLDRKGSRTT